MLYVLVFLINLMAALFYLVPAFFVHFGPTGESALAILLVPFGGLIVAGVLKYKGQDVAAWSVLASLTIFNAYWLTHFK
jgi:hypothetical protein